MRKLHILYIIIWSLVFASCEVNELPEDDFEPSVFYLEGTLDGEEFNLLAGPDNVVVHTDSDTEEGEIPQFSVEFFNSDCEECSEKLELIFTGNDEYIPGGAFSDFIEEGAYDISSYEVISAQVPFVYELNTLGDFNIVDEEGLPVYDSDVATNELVFEEGCYGMTFNSFASFEGCGYMYNGFFQVNSLGEIFMPQAYFYEEFGDLYMDVSHIPEESEIIVNSNFISSISFDPEAINVTELLEEDEILQSVLIQLSEEFCSFGNQILYVISPGFSDEFCFDEIFFEPIEEFYELGPHQVKIKYTNSEGEEYFSGDMTAGEYFNIVNIEPYSDGTSAEETFTVQVEFNASLANAEDSSDEIELSISEAFIPIVFE